jgi:DNA-binding XRE family transcriptional regulator
MWRQEEFSMPESAEKLPPWAVRIAELRKKLGMNQAEFARSLGAGQGNVSKWEAGKNRPTPDTFALMAKIAPDVDKFYFLDEAGIPRELFMCGVERVLPSQLMMATCVKCGTWSGIGQNVHNPDCDGVAKTQPTEADEFVDRLRPLVMKAAMRAGIAAGVTFAVLMAVAGILWGIFVSATHN